MSEVFHLDTDEIGMRTVVRTSREPGKVIISIEDTNFDGTLLDTAVPVDQLIDAACQSSAGFANNGGQVEYHWSSSPPEGSPKISSSAVKAVQKSIGDLLTVDATYEEVRSILVNAFSPRPRGAEEIETAIGGWSGSEYIDHDDIQSLADHLAREIGKP